MTSPLRFDGQRPLTPADLETAAAPLAVTLSEAARAQVVRCERFVREEHARGTPIYGLTTGFGPHVRFDAAKSATEQGQGLLNHLRAGQGEALSPLLARAMLLARTWSLSRGRSGVSVDVVDALTTALATRWTPWVPEWGSVGASGDLLPLAHATAALCGEGEALWDGARIPGAEALQRAGLQPLQLRGRDALGLVNGTSLTAAAAGLTVASARRAITVQLELTALLVETLGAGSGFTTPALLQASGHDSATRVAQRLSARLPAPAMGRGLQEPYSIRCVPQLVGAVEETVAHAERVVTADLNGVSDNPVFFTPSEESSEGLIVHGGNFFGQQVAFVADGLNLALTQLANLAERQLDLLLDPHRNGGLPLLLSAQPGAQSGLAGVNLAATAVTAAMRRYATPSSVQSLPTNGHNQDIVPFGNQAALEALRQSERLQLVQASLALGLRQAAYLGAPAPRMPENTALLESLSARAAPVDPDRPLSETVQQLARFLATR